MGKKKSLKSKAVHFVTDLMTTGLLNPISDKPFKPPRPPPEIVSETKRSQRESTNKENDGDIGPDTSSFTAFLYSLLSSSESGQNVSLDERNDDREESDSGSDTKMKENSGRKSLLSKGKQSLRALYQATRIRGYQNQDKKGDSAKKSDDKGGVKFDGLEMRRVENVVESLASGDLPETSEPSLLLTEKTRNALHHFRLLFTGESGYCCTVHGGMVFHCQHCTEEACSGLASVCWLLETVKVQCSVVWLRHP